MGREWLAEAVARAVPEMEGERIVFIGEARGGDIGKSYRIETERRKWFVKYRLDVPADVFRREAEGLGLLSGANALAVPETLYAGEIPGRTGGMIVLSWIETGPSRPETAEALGRGLAALHRNSSPDGRFGLHADNYLGLLPQANAWSGDWVAFYRERRLVPLARLAETRGLMPAGRRNRMGRLVDALERWLPAAPEASLLHGDLWGGNWLAGEDGRPWLIDPAVYYGDRECELAFTELFGGFPPRFYAAYREAYPLAPEYEERKPLYQLYYLLAHLVLFGESYGPSVDRVLGRYVG
jgi:fructosamine-3-kinase